LAATINLERPDLVKDFPIGSTHPIAREMPPRYLDKEVFHVEDIGVPTTACNFTRTNVDPTNWYLANYLPYRVTTECYLF